MEQKSSRTGWNESDTNMLMERAQKARQEGRPLREVFEATAFETGRKPNSIRNFYYAQSRGESGVRREHFTPFEADEASALTEKILSARANGESVRACVTRLAGGDPKLMLRYQNKYRAMLKTRPEVVAQILEKLRDQGLTPPTPYRGKGNAGEIMDGIRAEYGKDRRVCDMLLTLEQLLSGRREEEMRIAANYQAVVSEAQLTLECVKEYLAMEEDRREEMWGAFICELVKRAAELEQSISQSASV